jgi:hypothetical protein
VIDSLLFLKVFPDPLNIHSWTPVELQEGGYDTQQYTLLADFRVNEPSGSFIVPAGFQTDFASIPRAVWSLMDPEDPVIQYPSVSHDWKYSNQGRVSPALLLTKQQADQYLAYDMGVCGANWFQRKMVLSAVSAFGGSHWNTRPLAA